jgi:arylsulfatase A-like enzyme
MAYHALIRGRWKLMQNDPFSPLELYDLQTDPREKSNLIDARPGVVNSMKRSLSLHIQRGGRVPWQP